jgi:hypothetical protein
LRSFIIGQVAQNNLIHLKNTKQKNKTKKKQKKVGFLPNDLFLDLSVKIVCQSIIFEVFKTREKAKGLSVSTFLYKFTIQS